MRQVKRNRNRRRGGFTLLEILIVVGIIAILAAFVVPSLMRRGEKAKEDMTRSLIDSSGPVATALDMYKLDMGSYPEELTQLTEDPGDEEGKWHGPYLNDPTKLKDAWGQPLEYTYPSEVKGDGYYDLWSNGKDGEEGTDDDIKNWTEG